MRNLSQTVISAANAAVTETSAAISCAQIYAVSVQASFTNTPSGTLTIQASNDLGNATPSNWSTIATATVSSGALTLIQNTTICYQWIRVNWVNTSGAGTITVNINSQGF